MSVCVCYGCMYVCMCVRMRMDVSMYVCMCAYMRMDVSVHVCVPGCREEDACEHVYGCIYVCVRACICCEGARVCVCMRACGGMNVSAHVCMHARMWRNVCTDVCMHARMWRMHVVCVGACMYACMHVCMCACGHVYGCMHAFSRCEVFLVFPDYFKSNFSALFDRFICDYFSFCYFLVLFNSRPHYPSSFLVFLLIFYSFNKLTNKYK
jgi:hypothetical protein